METEDSTARLQRIVSTRTLNAEVNQSRDKFGAPDFAIVIGKPGCNPGRFSADELLELPELLVRTVSTVIEILDEVDRGGIGALDLYNLLSLMAEQLGMYRDVRVRIGNDRQISKD